MFKIETVNQVEYCKAASSILNESWLPTALDYSPEYLSWQFRFPSKRMLPGVVAWHGTDLIGFAGVTCRQMWYRGTATEFGIISFVAVRPAWRGQGVAARMYTALLSELRHSSIPLLIFTLKDSIGERTLLRACERERFQVRSLGIYPTLGRVVAASHATEVMVEPTLRNELPLSVFERCRDSSMILKWNDKDQLSHYRDDPRVRHLVLLHRANDEVCGAAWIVRSQLKTLQGPQLIATIDSVLLPHSDADALTALFNYAGNCWNQQTSTSALVIAPNLITLNPNIMAAVGLRQMATKYRCHLCTSDLYENLSSATLTNLEVI